MKKQLLHRKVKNLGLVGFPFALYPHYNLAILSGRASFIGLNSTKPHPCLFLSAPLSSLLIISFSSLGFLLVCRPTTEFNNHCWEFCLLKCIRLKDLWDVHSSIWIWTTYIVSHYSGQICFSLEEIEILLNWPAFVHCYRYVSVLDRLRDSK